MSNCCVGHLPFRTFHEVDKKAESPRAAKQANRLFLATAEADQRSDSALKGVKGVRHPQSFIPSDVARVVITSAAVDELVGPDTYAVEVERCCRCCAAGLPYFGVGATQETRIVFFGLFFESFAVVITSEDVSDL